MTKSILFICNGNIYRSIIAQAYLIKQLKQIKKDHLFIVDSAGLQGSLQTKPPKYKKLCEYKDEWKIAKPLLEKIDLSINKYQYSVITKEKMKQADIIIAMDELVLNKQRNSLINQFPEYKHKFNLFADFCKKQSSPKDPYQNKDQADHEEIFDLIVDGVGGGVSFLIF